MSSFRGITQRSTSYAGKGQVKVAKPVTFFVIGKIQIKAKSVASGIMGRNQSVKGDI